MTLNTPVAGTQRHELPVRRLLVDLETALPRHRNEARLAEFGGTNRQNRLLQVHVCEGQDTGLADTQTRYAEKPEQAVERPSTQAAVGCKF